VDIQSFCILNSNMKTGKIYSSKKWLKKVLFLSSGLLLFVAFFNFTEDTAGIFYSNNGLPAVAKSLANGKMIGGLKNYDERKLQSLIIEYQDKDVFCAVIGSSRVMEIRFNYLKNACPAKFINHGMSGASIEDYMAIIGLYESAGYLPKKVIMGIDPWIFNKNSGQTRWRGLEVYYKKVFEELYGTKIINKQDNKSKYLQLVNYDYTIENLMTLVNGEPKYYITDTIEVDDMVIQSDGSINYPLHIRFQNDDATKDQAKAFGNAPVYGLEKFYEMSNEKLFEDFVYYLQKQGIEVIFVLPPYHPITYNILTNNPKYKIIEHIETYLRFLSAKRGVRLVGSYDPRKYDLISVDFIDGMHSRDIVMEKLCRDLN
jgi:hypothetical protein